MSSFAQGRARWHPGLLSSGFQQVVACKSILWTAGLLLVDFTLCSWLEMMEDGSQEEAQ